MSQSNLLGPEAGIPDLLDYVTTRNLQTKRDLEKKGQRHFHPLRPSSAGKCSRLLALELMEYRGHALYEKPLNDPALERLFQLGHKVEHAVIDSLKQLTTFNIKYKQQVVSLFTLERENGLPAELIEGSLDLTLINDKYKMILDVKSKKDKFSIAYKTHWDEILEKYAKMKSLQQITERSFYAENLEAFIEELNHDWITDNLLQLNLYACSDFVTERGINVASLLYYCKNDSRMFEIRFKPSKEVFHSTQQKFQRIATTVDQKRIPETCEFPLGSMRRAFCQCEQLSPIGEGDPLKAWFKTFPKKQWPTEITKLSKPVQKLMKAYKEGLDALDQQAKIEAALTEALFDAKINKVKLTSGEVFEVKLLKSPREHLEMRRSKA